MSSDERVGGYRGGKPASEMGPPARVPSGSLTAPRAGSADAFITFEDGKPKVLAPEDVTVIRDDATGKVLGYIYDPGGRE